MPASIISPADLVNLALGKIGYKDRVGNLYEGSMAAKQSLDLYAQTRDEMLRSVDYAFAQRVVNMTLLKSASFTGYFPPNAWNGTNNPPVPWNYSYAYPDDCLKVRAIKSTPRFIQNFDPQPVSFQIENDNYYTPARKVILTNVQDAQLVYTGQVTDPATWEADYVEAFADALGRRLAPVLANMDAAKFEAAAETASTNTAGMTQG